MYKNSFRPFRTSSSLFVGFSIFVVVILSIDFARSCDDDGAWAEILASTIAKDNKPTYIFGGVFGIHQTYDDDSDDDSDIDRPNIGDDSEYLDEEQKNPIVNLKCDCTYQESVFLVEAMIYAIDQINQRHDLLPDVELGYNILGSCDMAAENVYFALEEYSLMEMQISNLTDDNPLFDDEDQQQGEDEGDVASIGDHFIESPVAGVIGPCSSDGSASIANILRAYGIPIISYGATVSELSKRSRFPTLFRTVYSDDKQVEALSDLSRSFDWTYMAAVGSDDDMGHEGVESFKRIINAKGMCLSTEAYFDITDRDDSHLIKIIDDLKNRNSQTFTHVSVVLLFMEWEYARNFLQQANSLQLTNVTWLGVDHWVSDVGMTIQMPNDYLAAPYTKGTIATQFSSPRIPEFADYMETNLVERQRANKWLMHFYCDQCRPKLPDDHHQSENFTCTLEFASSQSCIGNVSLSAIILRQRRIPNVFNAVYAAAHALDDLLRSMDDDGRRNRTAVMDLIERNRNWMSTENRWDSGDDVGRRSEDGDSRTSSTSNHVIIRNSTDQPSTSPSITTADSRNRSTTEQSGTTRASNSSKPPPLSIYDYDLLIDSLASVNFSFKIGMYQSQRISFRADGDLNDAAFDIVNFFEDEHAYCYEPSKGQPVGTWLERDGDTSATDDYDMDAAESSDTPMNQTGILQLNASKIRWQNPEAKDGEPPPSYCHRSCPVGEVRVAGPTSCCWSCEACPTGWISTTINAAECTQCPSHSYSNDDHTACIPNERTWITYSDTAGAICIALCVVGELFTLIAAIICCKATSFHDDGGYAMKTVVFINFALAYSYVSVIFSEPTIRSCTIRIVMWQSLATANLVAKFFMLPQGRRAAARLARTLGIVRPYDGLEFSTSSRTRSTSIRRKTTRVSLALTTTTELSRKSTPTDSTISKRSTDSPPGILVKRATNSSIDSEPTAAAISRTSSGDSGFASTSTCSTRLTTTGVETESELRKEESMSPARSVSRQGTELSLCAPSTISTTSKSSTTSSLAFAQRWICEICYAVVMTLTISTYVLSGVLLPPHVGMSDYLGPQMLLYADEVQANQTMLYCSPNLITTGISGLFLCALWILNLITSSTLYRRARRRRNRSTTAALTASGQRVARRTAVEFHASNLLWSGYLTVLVLIVVIPLYVTTDDPWSRGIFQIYAPFVIITLLLGVFAMPRCWHAVRTIYCRRGQLHDSSRGGSMDGGDRSPQPSSFIISSANDFQLRKMSTIQEDESTGL